MPTCAAVQLVAHDIDTAATAIGQACRARRDAPAEVAHLAGAAGATACAAVGRIPAEVEASSSAARARQPRPAKSAALDQAHHLRRRIRDLSIGCVTRDRHQHRHSQARHGAPSDSPSMYEFPRGATEQTRRVHRVPPVRLSINGSVARGSVSLRIGGVRVSPCVSRRIRADTAGAGLSSGARPAAASAV